MTNQTPPVSPRAHPLPSPAVWNQLTDPIEGTTQKIGRRIGQCLCLISLPSATYYAATRLSASPKNIRSTQFLFMFTLASAVCGAVLWFFNRSWENPQELLQRRKAFGEQIQNGLPKEAYENFHPLVVSQKELNEVIRHFVVKLPYDQFMEHQSERIFDDLIDQESISLLGKKYMDYLRQHPTLEKIEEQKAFKCLLTEKDREEIRKRAEFVANIQNVETFQALVDTYGTLINDNALYPKISLKLSQLVKRFIRENPEVYLGKQADPKIEKYITMAMHFIGSEINNALRGPQVEKAAEDKRHDLAIAAIALNYTREMEALQKEIEANIQVEKGKITEPEKAFNEAQSSFEEAKKQVETCEAQIKTLSTPSERHAQHFYHEAGRMKIDAQNRITAITDRPERDVRDAKEWLEKKRKEISEIENRIKMTADRSTPYFKDLENELSKLTENKLGLEKHCQQKETELQQKKDEAAQLAESLKLNELNERVTKLNNELHVYEDVVIWRREYNRASDAQKDARWRLELANSILAGSVQKEEQRKKNLETLKAQKIVEENKLHEQNIAHIVRSLQNSLSY